MPNSPPTPHNVPAGYTKRPGLEPLPGYVLTEPLGRGGFGEVWRCVAPGGMRKAVKIVAGEGGRDDTQLRQEFEAFQRVKAIRHPYLVSLERVELVGAELVMVMGLADGQLGDHFDECRRAGRPGIPRAALLGYLGEAAEALDVIAGRYGLQHLDVKPANLFLTAGHVQVGDFGLVSPVDGGAGRGASRGLTPKYAAPEVLRGHVHPRSDQYSLALVYHELLTGTFPFTGRTAPQLMLQHATAAPDLSGLPAGDRASVARALAKQPEDRFPTCRDFIDALAAPPGLARAGPGGAAGGRTPGHPTTHPVPAAARELVGGTSGSGVATRLHTPATTAPRLVVVDWDRPAGRPVPPPPAAPPVRPPLPRAAPGGVLLSEILSVVPVGRLRGLEAPDPDLRPDDVVRAVLARASEVEPAAAGRVPDGAWECRFRTAMDPRMARVKLDLLWEQGGLTMDARDEHRVVFRQPAPAGSRAGRLLPFGAKSAPSGLEVEVRLAAAGGPAGEVYALGRLYGTPPAEFARQAGQSIAALLGQVREYLGTAPERRTHPRLPVRFPLGVYPVGPDGDVGPPVAGVCQDVSAGGLAVRTVLPPPSPYVYVAFDGVDRATGLAVLVQVVRSDRRDGAVVMSGRYRLDLWPPPTA